MHFLSASVIQLHLCKCFRDTFVPHLLVILIENMELSQVAHQSIYLWMSRGWSMFRTINLELFTEGRSFLACQGIRVQVRSVYVKGRSQPSKGQYFFAYRIRINNCCNRTVQLLRRHWAITDAVGKTEHIW